jgi:hypothetical protein
MFVRVPVPWGKEPKAQFIAAGRKGPAFALSEDEYVPRPTVPRVPKRSGTSPIVTRQLAIRSRKPRGFALEADPDFKPKIREIETLPTRVEARAPVLPVVPMLRGSRWRQLAPALAKWAIARGIIKATPPRIARAQVSALPPTKGLATYLPLVKRLQQAKKYRDISALPTRVEAKRPVMPSSLVRERVTYKEMPPAIAKWAIEKGIKKAEPPKQARPAITAMPTRSQVALAALQAGEWVRVSDVDIIPPRTKWWLEERKCTFVRCFRWGGGQAGPSTPANGYVTESGLVFYVAEDGTTYYVQEH